MGTQRLLILGASGFLGPHLVRAALANGWEVVAAARRPAPATLLSGADGVALERWDAEQDGLEELLTRARPVAVVLAAALSRVGDCEREPERAALLNTALPAEAARLARRHGLRLVHLSTDLVFGARAPRDTGFAEEDPAAPLHAYGRTKAAGEERVLAEDPSALVARLPLLYGDSAGRGLGATDQILAALVRGERPALFTDEWRTPLEAGNAACALLELCSGNARGFLHLGGPLRLSRHELGLALLRARGWEPARARSTLRAVLRADLGLEAPRPADVSLDARRARALLATPLVAPDEALAVALP